MEFVIDTEGDEDLINRQQFFDNEDLLNATIDSDEEKPSNNTGNELEELINKMKIFERDILEEEEKGKTIPKKHSEKKVDDMIDSFFRQTGWSTIIGKQTAEEKKERSKNKFRFTNINFETGKMNVESAKTAVDKCMEKSNLSPGLEKEITLPRYNMSDRKLKLIRKREKEGTKGPSWYNLPAPEITEEIKNDLEVLRMRSALDPKHFYKKNDMKVLPKYFQIGTVVDSPLDHRNVRLTKKERKRTLVDELLVDAEFNKYSKQKYKEIVEEKRKSKYRTYIKDKRKKNKQLHKKRKEDKVNKKSHKSS